MSQKHLSRRDFLKISSGVAAGTLLAACQPAATPVATKAPAAAPATAAPAKQTVKLRWWGGVPDVSGPKQSIEAWNKANPDIQVEYVQYSNNDEGNVKLDTALLVPNEVDVFVSYGLPRFKKRADGGLIEPLDSYLAGFDPDKEFGKTENKWDNKTWCLIANMQPYLVYCNMKAFEEASLKVPAAWTWAEFFDAAKKLTKGSGPQKRYGVWFNPFGQEPALWIKDNDFIYKGACETNFDDPLFEWSFNQRVKMELEDKTGLARADITAGKIQVQNAFLQGQVAMLAVGSWVLRYVKDLANFPRDWKTAFAPLPMDADKAYTVRPGNCDDRVAINSKATNKAAAWKFMKWWTTEGYVNMTPFGRTTLWRGRKPEESAQALISDFPDYAKYLDVDTYKSVMFGKMDMSFPRSTQTVGLAEINQVVTEESDKIFLGESKLKDGLTNMKKRADEVLKKVCK
jgi:multiple sugar transport system substrate-binding protein